jgi:hypothetical protein
VTHFDYVADAERRARGVRHIQRDEPPSCPHCGRMITQQEKDQGACSDCYGEALELND